MKAIKKLAVVFAAVVCALNFCVFSSAEEIDFTGWNTCDFHVYEVATQDVPTNSDLIAAELKVRYEDEPHRMVMLFMLKFNSFGEEGNPGVRFSLNGGEMLSLSLNGETEYNEDIYYLDFLSYVMPVSGTAFFEVTFGVKPGLPEEKVFSLIFYDPQGVPSNTYTVDLNENPQSDCQEGFAIQNDKAQSKTNNSKTKNKTRADKTKIAEDGKDAFDPADTTQAESALAKSNSSENEKSAPSADKKVLLTFAAIFVAGAFALTGGLHFLKRKKHKGDKG